MSAGAAPWWKATGEAARAAPWPDRPAAPSWIASVLRLQVGIVYVFAGIAKLNGDWLGSALPLRIWLSARTGTPLVGPLFDEPWVAFAMSWGGAAFDLTIPFLLMWRRSRPWAYLAVIGFHAMTAALFPIGIFPWIMIGVTLVFFEGEEMVSAGRFLRGGLGRGHGAADTGGAPAVRGGIPAVPAPRLLPVGARYLLVAHFILQLLLPLRHLAYPGEVLWTEEGFRFSWRVMLVEKTGAVFYRVTDPASGRSWEVHPGNHLTPMQAKQMAFQPDMILDFAHLLRDRIAAEGGGVPEVRAEAFVSLNGRPAALLIDPTVDLARTERGFGPKGWILPPPGALPALAVDSGEGAPRPR